MQRGTHTHCNHPEPSPSHTLQSHMPVHQGQGRKGRVEAPCVPRATRCTPVRNHPFVQLHTQTSPENLAGCLEEGFPRLKIRLKFPSGTEPYSTSKAPSRVPSHQDWAPLAVLNKPHVWSQSSEGRQAREAKWQITVPAREGS